MNSAQQLTKTEQAVMSLFSTKRNEDGRVQVWTIPQCKAAWNLQNKGLVRCQYRDMGSKSIGCVDVWMAQ
jgi:hypothetical protein